MAENLEYTYPGDELVAVADTITLTVGTPATGYGTDKLSNFYPDDPFKVESTTFRIVLDFGSAVAPKLAAVIHHNLVPGYDDLFLQGNATNVWTSPSFSQAFAAASYLGDDFPVNLSMDLRTTSPSYRYWSLAATTANSVNISIGEFLLY